MGDALRDLEHESRRKMTETQEQYATTCISKTHKREISIFVSGIAAAQGRPRFRRAGNFVQAYDPAKSKSWKESVRWQAIESQQKEQWEMLDGAIEASIVFLLLRPKTLPKKVKRHIKKPDVENLVKGIFDALEGIAYRNDSQIFRMTVEKHYEDKLPGVSIILRSV